MIIFYDGECKLCKHFIKKIKKADKQNKFSYTPLQEARNLPKIYTKTLSTVVYKEHNKLYTKSTAVLKIYKQLGHIYLITQLAYLIPKPIRNAIYDFIAKRRKCNV